MLQLSDLVWTSDALSNKVTEEIFPDILSVGLGVECHFRGRQQGVPEESSWFTGGTCGIEEGF
jgi:hypothetical protein